MNAEWELQTAIYGNLEASLSVPVYDDVPQDADAPYVTIGQATFVEFSTDGRNGFDCTQTVHVWSDYQGTKECKLLQGAVYDSLNRVELAVTGYTVLGPEFEYSEVTNDPNGITRHGIQRFRIRLIKL